MRLLIVGIVAAALALGACSSAPDTTDAARSPAPREAPETPPDKNFDEAPEPAAGPPDAADKAAAEICNGLAKVADAESPEDALRALARKARKEGVQFHRFVTLLQRAYVDGDVDKARSYIDRLSALCENVTGRRNF
jgi:hypothetical protein